ncbi:MAG: ImmA/IrrE family metallo-endopeptidase [Bacteroidales bacterium]|nr:ImmA/IrrE family metallo-endopeptidase [Bacteroidales bacterium]
MNTTSPQKGKKRGSRGLSLKYKEPDLLKNAEDILRKAEEKGFYVGDSLDIERLVSTIDDIVVLYEDMDGGKSGSLYQKDGKWIITINNKHHKNRQRFTLAHELGHYILHKEKNATFEDTAFFRGGQMDAIEYAANSFAATILMPEEKLKGLIDSGIRSVSLLANKFNISTSALKYRLEELGYKIK